MTYTKGLTNKLAEKPPSVENTNYAPYRSRLKLRDLASFLGKYQGEYESTWMTILVPDDVTDSPSIEISREMCQDLIDHVMDVIESERGLLIADRADI